MDTTLSTRPDRGTLETILASLEDAAHACPDLDRDIDAIVRERLASPSLSSDEAPVRYTSDPDAALLALAGIDPGHAVSMDVDAGRVRAIARASTGFHEGRSRATGTAGMAMAITGCLLRALGCSSPSIDSAGEIRICGAVPPFLLQSLVDRFLSMEADEQPTTSIGDPDLYMERWRVWGSPGLDAKLHVFHRSDDPRASHDHPWESMSICLREGAVDVARDGTRIRIVPGMVVYRSADYAHRVEVDPGTRPMTLFLTGPKIREWGFLCPSGWRHWREFAVPARGSESGAAGLGCD